MNSDIEEYDELQSKVIQETKQAFTALESSEMKLSYSQELSKFTRKDYEEFNELAHELNLETRRRLIEFYEEKARKKIKEFHAEMLLLKERYDRFRVKYKSNKVDTGISLQTLQKEELLVGNRIEKVMTSIKRKESLDKYFRAWTNYHHEIKFRTEIIAFCKKIREKNVKERIIHGWKHMFITAGIHNKARRKFEADLSTYKEQYLEMIALLQTNIKHVEDEIYTRRLARKEFSFNLSRNLLKTISNLSMDIVSLNQFSIKDKDSSGELEQMNATIKSKLKELEKIKVHVEVQEDIVEEVETKKVLSSRAVTTQLTGFTINQQQYY